MLKSEAGTDLGKGCLFLVYSEATKQKSKDSNQQLTICICCLSDRHVFIVVEFECF